MVKAKASWKGLDRKYLLSSDPYKNINIAFMTYKPGCYRLLNAIITHVVMHIVNTM